MELTFATVPHDPHGPAPRCPECRTEMQHTVGILDDGERWWWWYWECPECGRILFVSGAAS